ncbi:MAG: acetyl-CoA C-acetyltransferase [Limosilactobacillus gorillae]|jgi:acetyl-CoA C-acetyltransferase|uniref:acetyl-CoA C-acetyltransferase n=1 Tax=Limosilactobacillus gorillae TaxID=1450649 RepID=UPI000A42EBC4|nr:acetyl-CoA C-acetyltransferase [Limosilactobacillus gorillae]MDO4855169.1 acetyl-CoA C-acetyltransferase [Limosilactobacillus gorillae]
MEKVVFVGAARTPIGKLGGSLATMTAAQLGTVAIQAALNRAKVAPSQVDEVYLGCAIQAGQGQNVARQASVNAGLPVTVPATTVNVMCGSGMHAVNLAAKLIAMGDAEVMVAGGTESMSSAPYLVPKGRFGYKYGNAELVDSLYKDGLEDAFYHYPMGCTAENLVEKYQVTRQELDHFAMQSQVRARTAQNAGRFKDEIVPVTVKGRKHTVEVTADEAIRDTSLEKLATLKPVFKEDGDVTAGNSSGLNDGAAALILMSERRALAEGKEILGYWQGGTLAGVEPSIMGIGPLAATQKLLSKTQLSPKELDLVEINEAFAAQAIVCEHELGLDEAKVNVNGGAIALGHPLGDSGARILVTLLYQMRRQNAKRGLATLCIGGGMGAATLIYR